MDKRLADLLDFAVTVAEGDDVIVIGRVPRRLRPRLAIFLRQHYPGLGVCVAFPRAEDCRDELAAAWKKVNGG